MALLQSLHVGVNKVDPKHYGSEAPLRGCENDARDMEELAAKLGYKTELLLTRDATSKNFLASLLRAADVLVPGDTFLLTLACHGSQIDDVDKDEDDNRDETWCLFDRMVIDDEAFASFQKFRQGVRIFVLSDSCHSGTSTRMLVQAASTLSALNYAYSGFRCIDEFLDRSVFDKFIPQYAAIQHALKTDVSDTRNLGPDVILISGCQDRQTSGDGPTNGVFTKHLKDVWNKGAFNGNYKTFQKAIANSINSPLQIPNFLPYGPSVSEFMTERPFLPVKKSRTKKLLSESDRKGVLPMPTSSLHPAVYEILRARTNGRTLPMNSGSEDRGFEAGCTVTIRRSMLEGKTDEQILQYFTEIIAPEMCSNYFAGRDAFSGRSPRGGSVSCTVSTSREGSVSCTGTWTF